MFLHNVNFDNFDIRLEDTLLKPQHMQDAPFDAIVSNPPYSLKWEGKDNALLINDERYAPAGVLAPKNNADLAFTMHMLWHLSERGTAAIVEFPGVLYRGGDEKKIRQYLIKNNYVDTIIQLPANLFFGVGIATCIIVLRMCCLMSIWIRLCNSIRIVRTSSIWLSWLRTMISLRTMQTSV